MMPWAHQPSPRGRGRRPATATQVLALCLLLSGALVTLAMEDRYDDLTRDGRASYRGYKLLRVAVPSTDDFSYLLRLAAAHNPQIELWNDLPVDSRQGQGQGARELRIHVAPQIFPSVQQQLTSRGLAQTIVSDDLQTDIGRHLLAVRLQARLEKDYFQNYHPFSEILEYMDELATFCGSRCDLFDIGTSYEGRPLRVLKVMGAGGPARKSIWIDSGIHAREWIAHATNQFLMSALVRGYDTDPVVREMTDAHNWYFLPVLNPDGYEYTWTTDRLWRKTRRPNYDSDCVGTDANRNFKFHWGTVGADAGPCSNTYAGPEPFSEPESTAVARALLAHNGTWDMFLTLHSKGQLILAPWGFTDRYPKDYPELERVGRIMQKAIHDTHGKQYTFGTSSDVLYQSSGTSRDWVKGVTKTKYVYTLELRDRGQHGWLLPPQEIVPTGEEIWAAVQHAIRAIKSS